MTKRKKIKDIGVLSLPVLGRAWSCLVVLGGSGTPLARTTQLTTKNQATFSGVGARSEVIGPLSGCSEGI